MPLYRKATPAELVRIVGVQHRDPGPPVAVVETPAHNSPDAAAIVRKAGRPVTNTSPRAAKQRSRMAAKRAKP